MSSEDLADFETLGELAEVNGIRVKRESVNYDNPLDALDGEGQIFADEELLELEYIPGEDKIVGRAEEIAALARLLRDVISGKSGRDAMITGVSGSGKSLVSKYVSREVVRRGEANDVQVGLTAVDCGQWHSETQVLRDIANDLNPPDSEITIPASGIATGDYYDRLWAIINNHYDSVIVILDEIDELEPPKDPEEISSANTADARILMQLSRAGEEGDIDSGLSVISISNDLSYTDRFDMRLNSSYSGKHMVFTPYDATQLREILKRRKKAFAEGALSDGVIPLTAGLSAQEHGDARRAIQLFWSAGEVARTRGQSEVTENHVRTADQNVDVIRVHETLAGAPEHCKLALTALALLDGITEYSSFKAKTVYEVYVFLAEETGVDQLSLKRVSDLLRDYDTIRLIDAKKTSNGPDSGVYIVFDLLTEPEWVLRSVGLDGRYEDIPLTSDFKANVSKIADNRERK